MHVNKSDLEALIARGHLPEEGRRDPAAIKAAIETLMSDVVFELEAERSARRPTRETRHCPINCGGVDGRRPNGGNARRRSAGSFQAAATTRGHTLRVWPPYPLFQGAKKPAAECGAWKPLHKPRRY